MRKLSLFLTILGLIVLGFELTWNEIVGRLRREALSVRSTRVALNITAQTFEGERKDWLVKGSRAEFPKRDFVSVEGFKAEKGNGTLQVSADRALIDLRKGLIHLEGGVILDLLKGEEKYRILARSAEVDLKRGVIFGKSPCEVLSNKGTLKGKGFYYDYRNGIFSVEGGVTTVIGR